MEVKIPAGALFLEGELSIPKGSTSLVLFAHGSGSSRHSPRNQFVAKALQASGIGTLLFDLLTVEEDEVYETRFDIHLLTQRLIVATQWAARDARTKNLSLGYFGASTGAAAALMAAPELGEAIRTVVSRGGRPDLAMPVLDRVKAPALLIVGGLDGIVIDFNQQAYDRLGAEKKLVIVPGATHLFEEPGKLEEVARLATEWFRRYL